MPFIRVKVKAIGVKADINVAHIISFSPNGDDVKNTDIDLSDGTTYVVEESAQAVRGAIRRAETPVKEELSSGTAGE